MITVPTTKIACRPLDDPDKSPGGLWIPEIAKERSDQGIVKYVGSACSGHIKPGDIALFSGYSGDVIYLEGEGRLIIMEERSVVAIIQPPDEIDLPGVYFKGKDGEYFTASYEMMIEFMAEGVRDSKWFRELSGLVTRQGRSERRFKVPKPNPEDYDSKSPWEGTDAELLTELNRLRALLAQHKVEA